MTKDNQLTKDYRRPGYRAVTAGLSVNGSAALLDFLILQEQQEPHMILLRVLLQQLIIAELLLQLSMVFLVLQIVIALLFL